MTVTSCILFWSLIIEVNICRQGGHFSRKAGNVRKFDRCKRIDHISGKCHEKILSVKTVHGLPHA